MLCPHCHADISEHATEYGDHACASCGLAGPRDVLEALAAKLSPEGILVQAEALLRAREVHMLALLYAPGGVTLWGLEGGKIRSRGTLADAVARLERERGKGGRP